MKKSKQLLLEESSRQLLLALLALPKGPNLRWVLHKETFMKIKATLMTLCVLFSLPSFSLEEVVLKELTAQYEDGLGNISADSFNYRDSLFTMNADNINQDFNLADSLLQLNLGGMLELNYQLDPEGLVSKVSSVHTSGVDLHYIPEQKFSLSTNGISLSHSGGSQYIPELEVECKAAQEKAGLNGIVNPCLELGRIEIPVLDFDRLSSRAIAKALTGSSSNKGIEKIEEIAIMIFNGNFQLSFKAKFLFKLKIKAQGRVSYDEEAGTVELLLSKAKVGIFSIKKRLLKEIREANISVVKIVGDRVTFKI
jgi:hypothetical protein